MVAKEVGRSFGDETPEIQANIRAGITAYFGRVFGTHWEGNPTVVGELLLNAEIANLAHAVVLKTIRDAAGKDFDFDQGRRLDGVVLENRLGLTGDSPKSYAQIGRELNIKPRRVKRMELNALRRMRHPVNSRRNGIRTFIQAQSVEDFWSRWQTEEARRREFLANPHLAPQEI